MDHRLSFYTPFDPTSKLAAITFCDRNLLEIDPKEIIDMTVEMAIVDGKIVFGREG
ncbi:MAG TPA: hypothetical protein VLH75_00015 [Longimicrobiales bacterium]|nr:hypothetical protein [Longimicrobiales bacterium]